MKTLLTLLLTTFCVTCFAQSPVNPYKQIADQNKKPEPTIAFDALNGAIIQESINADKYKAKTDSAKREIVLRMLQVKRIGLERLGSGDSTLITPQGIYLKLKPKKK